jgi:glycyl-tRNA synthetase alpha chain
VDSVWDITWNKQGIKYKDVFLKSEIEYSAFNFKYADTNLLIQHFNDSEKECKSLLKAKLAHPAYDQCVKAGHIFNLLNARSVIGVTERASYIARVRNLAKECCQLWLTKSSSFT